MKLVFSVAFAFSSFFALAQYDTLLQECRTRDSIWFSQYLKPVFRKMNKSKIQAYKTVTRIVQIGDSHVQMGYFSSAVGAQLNQLYGKAVTNSYWFPYAEVGGFNPKGVGFNHSGNWKGEKMVNSASERRFGISGHALILMDKGAEQPHLNVTQETKIGKFEVLIESNKTWRFCVDSATVTVRKLGNNLSVVTVAPFRPDFALRLNFCPEGNPVPLRILGFRNATSPVRQGIDFQYYGSSGGKFSDYTGNANYLLENIDYLNPDMLVISLGTNDTYAELTADGYYKMVKNFIRQLRKREPGMVILLTMPPDTFFKQTKPRSAQIVFSTLFKVAQEEGCGLWNFAEVMGGDDSMLSWCSKGLADKDLMHLNPQGYDIQGLLLAEAINKAYLKYYK